MSQDSSIFDYSSLKNETAEYVQQRSQDIRVLMRRTTQDIIVIGQKLLQVKTILEHGQFGLWLRAEFGWSHDTANNFMQVARQFGDNPKISEFAPSALYILAAPSTPGTAREEALTRAQMGEFINYKVEKEITQKHSSASRGLRKRQTGQVVSQKQGKSQENQEASGSTPQVRSLVQPKLKLLAIHPKDGNQNARQQSEVISPLYSAPSPKFDSSFVGSWWKLGERHRLYCGNPYSRRFRERLPSQLSLVLAFPPYGSDVNLSQLPSSADSVLTLCSKYQDYDLVLLQELVERALQLYTESQDRVVFWFLPDVSLLTLADCLDCSCFVADPDEARCRQIVDVWKTRANVERITSVRF